MATPKYKTSKARAASRKAKHEAFGPTLSVAAPAETVLPIAYAPSVAYRVADLRDTDKILTSGESAWIAVQF